MSPKEVRRSQSTTNVQKSLKNQNKGSLAGKKIEHDKSATSKIKRTQSDASIRYTAPKELSFGSLDELKTFLANDKNVQKIIYAVHKYLYDTYIKGNNFGPSLSLPSQDNNTSIQQIQEILRLTQETKKLTSIECADLCLMIADCTSLDLSFKKSFVKELAWNTGSLMGLCKIILSDKTSLELKEQALDCANNMYAYAKFSNKAEKEILDALLVKEWNANLPSNTLLNAIKYKAVRTIITLSKNIDPRYVDFLKNLLLSESPLSHLNGTWEVQLYKDAFKFMQNERVIKKPEFKDFCLTLLENNDAAWAHRLEALNQLLENKAIDVQNLSSVIAHLAQSIPAESLTTRDLKNISDVFSKLYESIKNTNNSDLTNLKLQLLPILINYTTNSILRTDIINDLKTIYNHPSGAWIKKAEYIPAIIKHADAELKEIIANYLEAGIKDIASKDKNEREQVLNFLHKNINCVDNIKKRISIAIKVANALKANDLHPAPKIEQWLDKVYLSYTPTLVMTQLDFNQQIKLLHTRLGENFSPKNIKENAPAILNTQTNFGDGKIKKYPYTASEAQMKLLLGNKYIPIPNNGNLEETRKAIKENVVNTLMISNRSNTKESVINNLVDMLLMERKHEDKYAFYHGCNSSLALLYQGYCIFRSSLQNNKNPEVNAVFRSLDEAFLKVRSLDEFLKTMTERHLKGLGEHNAFNYTPNYQEMGVAQNQSIFGNLRNDASCTLSFWLSPGGSFDITQIARGFLSSLGGEEFANTFLPSYLGILNELNEKLSISGALLQSFIVPEELDTVGYFSQTLGPPVALQYEDGTQTYSLNKAITLARQDPDAYKGLLEQNKSAFAYGEARAKDNNAGVADCAEVRLFADPRVMSDPKLSASYLYYNNIDPHTDSEKVNKLKELQARQEVLVRDLIKKLFETGKGVSPAYISDASGNATPFERLFFLKAQESGGTLESLPSELKLAYQRNIYIKKMTQAVLENNPDAFDAACKDLEEIEQQNIPEHRRNPHKREPNDDKYNAATLKENPILSKNSNLNISGKADNLDTEIGNILRTQDFNSRELVELLSGYPEIQSLMSGSAQVSQGYTVKEHTLRVLDEFLGQHHSLKNGTEEPSEDGNINGTRNMSRFLDNLGLSDEKKHELKRFLSVVLVFHDIAKSCDRDYQHEYTTPVLVRYLAKLGYSANLINLAANLVDHDYLGEFIQAGGKRHAQAWEPQQRTLQGFADISNIDYPTFFALQLLFYTCDAVSYPNLCKQYFEPSTHPELQHLMVAKAQGNLDHQLVVPLERVILDTLTAQDMIGKIQLEKEQTFNLVSEARKQKQETLKTRQHISQANTPDEVIKALSSDKEFGALLDDSTQERAQAGLKALYSQGNNVLQLSGNMDGKKAFDMMKIIITLSALEKPDDNDPEAMLTKLSSKIQSHMAKWGYAPEDIVLATSLLRVHFSSIGNFSSVPKDNFDPIATSKALTRFADFNQLPKVDYIALQALFDASLTAIEQPSTLKPAKKLGGLWIATHSGPQYSFLEKEMTKVL